MSQQQRQGKHEPAVLGLQRLKNSASSKLTIGSARFAIRRALDSFFARAVSEIDAIKRRDSKLVNDCHVLCALPEQAPSDSRLFLVYSTAPEPTPCVFTVIITFGAPSW